MNLLSLSLKNAIVKWWRSLAIGSFIFFVSFLLVFYNSFVLTVQKNMEDSLIFALTGDIQIRSGKTEETDMFTLKNRWGDVNLLDAQKVKDIEKKIKQGIKYIEYIKRIRQNVLFISDTGKEPSMVIGLDPGAMAYREAFELIEGRYLDPKKSNEVLLSKTQADRLKVKVGDILGGIAQTLDGYTADFALTVVGIGNLKMLSIFEFYVAYVDIKSVQEFVGFEEGEVSDIIIYTKERKEVDQTALQLMSEFQKAGISTVMGKESSSSDADIRLTTWENMGGFIMGGIKLYSVLFYVFIGLLMIIVCILIINLIYMIGLERYKEIGTLRAIGFSKGNIIQIFMSEILLIAIFFCFLGVAAGSALVLLFSKIGISSGPPLSFVMGKQFFMKFDIGQIIFIIILVIGITFIASFYPSYKASSLRPAETLKEE